MDDESLPKVAEKESHFDLCVFAPHPSEMLLLYELTFKFLMKSEVVWWSHVDKEAIGQKLKKVWRAGEKIAIKVA